MLPPFAFYFGKRGSFHFAQTGNYHFAPTRLLKSLSKFATLNGVLGEKLWQELKEER